MPVFLIMPGAGHPESPLPGPLELFLHPMPRTVCKCQSHKGPLSPQMEPSCLFPSSAARAVYDPLPGTLAPLSMLGAEEDLREKKHYVLDKLKPMSLVLILGTVLEQIIT